MAEIKSKGVVYTIDEDTNQVSIGGLINPNWVVTSTLDDNEEGEFLGIHNSKTGEFISKKGEVRYTTNENDI